MTTAATAENTAPEPQLATSEVILDRTTDAVTQLVGFLPEERLSTTSATRPEDFSTEIYAHIRRATRVADLARPTDGDKTATATSMSFTAHHRIEAFSLATQYGHIFRAYLARLRQNKVTITPNDLTLEGLTTGKCQPTYRQAEEAIVVTGALTKPRAADALKRVILVHLYAPHALNQLAAGTISLTRFNTILKKLLTIDSPPRPSADASTEERDIYKRQLGIVDSSRRSFTREALNRHQHDVPDFPKDPAQPQPPEPPQDPNDRQLDKEFFDDVEDLLDLYQPDSQAERALRAAAKRYVSFQDMPNSMATVHLHVRAEVAYRFKAWLERGYKAVKRAKLSRGRNRSQIQADLAVIWFERGIQASTAPQNPKTPQNPTHPTNSQNPTGAVTPGLTKEQQEILDNAIVREELLADLVEDDVAAADDADALDDAAALDDPGAESDAQEPSVAERPESTEQPETEEQSDANSRDATDERDGQTEADSPEQQPLFPGDSFGPVPTERIETAPADQAPTDQVSAEPEFDVTLLDDPAEKDTFGTMPGVQVSLNLSLNIEELLAFGGVVSPRLLPVLEEFNPEYATKARRNQKYHEEFIAGLRTGPPDWLDDIDGTFQLEGATSPLTPRQVWDYLQNVSMVTTILTDPIDAYPVGYGRARYKPDDTLRHLVALRDVTCRAPGCTVRAADCELDHLVEWARERGITAYLNLIFLCPNHHAHKSAGWYDKKLRPDLGDGVVEFINTRDNTSTISRPRRPLHPIAHRHLQRELEAQNTQADEPPF